MILAFGEGELAEGMEVTDVVHHRVSREIREVIGFSVIAASSVLKNSGCLPNLR
jgi:hypothetical protein